MGIPFGEIKAITDLLLTAAITGFALGTWRATRSYARLTGLTLFLDNLKGTRASDPGDRKMSINALRIVRAEFPDIFQAIGPALIVY